MDFFLTIATSDADIAAVRRLCRHQLAWELATFPDHRAEIRAHHASHRWEAFLAALPDRFTGPNAAIFLARSGDTPVGCCFQETAADGTAELHRLYVRAEARGTGLGAALVAACLDHAKDCGARTMRLKTARFLTHAIALYRRLGFAECPPFASFPPEVRDVVMFMERPV